MDYILRQKHIKFIRDNFEDHFAKNLNLVRVSAPLFLEQSSGLNDNLNGIEKAVPFTISKENIDCEINQSLAKWKRVALQKYDFEYKLGLYTNMNAIRKDETLDAIHSAYVDQWDWEVLLSPKDRQMSVLEDYVSRVYQSILEISQDLEKTFGVNHLKGYPKKVLFIESQELENMYPNNTPKEREDIITKKHLAVFVIGIGKTLNSGKIHDQRSPDYDDWDLNGDLILWNNATQASFELSSMGIRVNSESLKKQLVASDREFLLKFNYHQDIINNKLPQTIGGGIGQSRLCMILLGCHHIGEVQASVWPEKTLIDLRKKGIKIL